MIVNKTQLAEIHSVTDRTVTDWAKAGMPVRAVGGPGRGHENQYDTAATIEWRIQRAITGFQVESAKERKDRLEGDRIELQLAKEAGLLVAVAEIEPLWESAVLAAKSDLMESIYRLKSDLDATYGVDVDVALLEAHVQQALSKLAEHPPIPPGGGPDEYPANEDHNDE
jgi:terminase small subunit / prophage DNA-packing protein